MKTCILTFLFLSISLFAFNQRAKHGDLTISGTNNIVNTYTRIVGDHPANSTSINVASNQMIGGGFSNALEPGDLILLYNIQGTTVNIYTAPTADWGGDYTIQNGGVVDVSESFIEFGELYDYWVVGKYEFAEVKEVQGTNTIVLTCPTKHEYKEGNGPFKAQIVRVPRYDNLTVPAGTSITSDAWNGSTGGIVALEVDKDFVLNGIIHADERGFRGGVASNPYGGMYWNMGSISDTSSRGKLGTSNPEFGGGKGESIYGDFNAYENLMYSRYGYGAIANGGGGGGFHNAGGGGGANVGEGSYYGYGVVDRGPSNSYDPAWTLESSDLINKPSAGGGRGGYSHANGAGDPLIDPPHSTSWSLSPSDAGDHRRIAGGVGGHPLSYDAERFFLGGGGGGGHQNDGHGTAGGAGGGAVLLNLYGNISGTGTVSANGQDAASTEGGSPPFSGITGGDGAGGGGGGGTVLIFNIETIPNSINLEAIGGKGGDEVLKRGLVYSKVEANGPGGGGAGGLIAYSNGTPTENVSGGKSGTTSASGGSGNGDIMAAFPVNGATDGASGLIKSTQFFDLIVQNDTICSGESISINVNVVGNMTPSSINWHQTYFTDVVNFTGNPYNLTNLTSTTTLFVGSCDGSFRKEVEIFVSPEITISQNPTIVDVDCDGNNGSITGITVSGGTGNYIFEWNGTITPTADLTNAPAGIYVLTVTDDAGCSETSIPFEIEQQGGLVIDVSAITVTPESCAGGDGEITGITVTGGVTPYTFEWDGDPLNNQIDFIGTAGNHTLVVTDMNGCSVTTSPINIASSSSIVVDETNIVIVNETCNTQGSITGLVASGGTGTLSFSWTNGGGTNIDINSAPAGFYSLTVSDNLGCVTTVGPYEIQSAQTLQLDETSVVVNHQTCNGEGSITGISVLTGAMPYSFEWNGLPSGSIDLMNAAPGSYTLQVTDANSCVVLSATYQINAYDPINIDLNPMTVTDESCNGTLGSISGIVVTGGEGSLNYLWSNGETTLDISNITAGNYTLTVTDDLGCFVVSSTISVAQDGAPIIDDANVVIVNATCGNNNGSISGLSASGGTLPYLISWDNTTDNTLDIDNLSAGTYTLIITDDLGCTASSSFVVQGDPAISLNENNVVVVNEGCDGTEGSITGLTVSGGTAPFIYEWNGNNTGSVDFPIAVAGNYVLTVTDVNGCSVTSGIYTVGSSINPTVDITTPSQEILSGQSIEIETLITPSGMDITWTPADDLSCVTCENPIASPSTTTMYYIEVISPDGCVSIDSILIEVNMDCDVVAFPTVFTPNGDGLNDVFCVLGTCVQSMELSIYNRWGEIIFKSNDMNDCWDGTYQGLPVNTGDYVYQFDGVLIDGTPMQKSGNINLLR
ncbi:MAG: gliding motility-associated C-terminal domain-containing protein [Brumimicrobium sp.]